MTAADAYNEYEEHQVVGLSKLLTRILSVSKSDAMTSMEVRKDKITEEQIKALRRRNFHVVYKDLVNNQKVPMVFISWDLPK